MKKIINNPENVVPEMCHGMVLAHPELEYIEKYKIITRRDRKPQKVVLISGGGSGHEPAHAGYVGEGMLDAAVCGDVFASPSQVQVYQAIKETANEAGTLLIIKNYSGDVMNFKNAAFMAREDGINVEYVKVDDDIAVQDSLYTVGHRGVAGTVFVHKIAGAAAERGCTLQEVKRIAEKTISNVRSIGFALTSCTVPAKGTPTFDLGADEIEYGVGIHGEPGTKREKITDAAELSERMVEQVTNSLRLSEGDRTAVIINGFGGTPIQELYVLNEAVQRQLDERGIIVEKTLVGNYMTSLDMAGASLSVLKLDDELTDLLFERCNTDGLKCIGKEHSRPYYKLSEKTKKTDDTNRNCFGNGKLTYNRLSKDNFIYIVRQMGSCILENEVHFCDMDSHAGDGDFGMSVAKGFRALEEEWNELTVSADDIGKFLGSCALIIMENCGGASGPIWGSAFRAAGKYAEGKTELNAAEFAELLQCAVKGIQLTGERSFGRGAVIGDKTLIDALLPCADEWSRKAETVQDIHDLFTLGAAAAVKGADHTKTIVARMGRAGTVGERSLGYPDAGAYALGVIFTHIAESLE